jgi:hypothetical protein
MKGDNEYFAYEFWGEISPAEHFVQIYESDLAFLDSLAKFVADGFKAGDAVIVITTLAHRVGLENRLFLMNFDLKSYRENDQYIPVDAKQTLEKFMIEGLPDLKRFAEQAEILINRTSKGQRKVRVFGEMVALLLAQGHKNAVIRLEQLWNELAIQHEFCLYCAYPKTGFAQDQKNSFEEICLLHSRVIPN